MEWKITPGLTQYPTALEAMASRVAAIQRGEEAELTWLVEHPPLYTLGTSAKEADILLPLPPAGEGRGEGKLSSSATLGVVESPSPQPSPASGRGGFPTYPTGRGGQVTYHGPGQRVAYVMRDLKRHAGASGPDIRAYVKDLEQWLICALREFGVTGMIRDGRVGVWVETPTGEAKIAALGVRVQKWVTSHGISLNVNPDLSHYAGIVPCGIREFGVTSLAALGVRVTMEEVDAVLKQTFTRVFN